MSRLVYEGRHNVYWATTVASKSAPTVANITAAIKLTDFVSKDGVSVNINTNNVDSATIAETFDAQLAGSWGADLELTMFRDDVADTAWDLCVYGTNGYLIIDRLNPSGTPPVAGDKVEVWPAQMHTPAMENSSSNSQQRFKEKFPVTSEPDTGAVVAV